MVQRGDAMSANAPDPVYALGSSDAELDRLKRQADLIGQFTKRLFRDAGITKGCRVLDVGSGGGDVSLLLSQIVGPSGAVVGIERNAEPIARARRRVDEMQLRNVTFVQSDAMNPPLDEQFDAVVGRLILMYLPDPVSTLRSLTPLLREGGVVASIEPSVAASARLVQHLPLCANWAAKFAESFTACGANPEMGLALHRTFLAAGLPQPKMKMEILFGTSNDFLRDRLDVLSSQRPQAEARGVSFAALGDFNTLVERMRTEVCASNDVVPWIVGLVGAWCRLPTSGLSPDTAV
jgi:ubiquinone/menaquinone biosynthesis C-methylase UbiE